MVYQEPKAALVIPGGPGLRVLKGQEDQLAGRVLQGKPGRREREVFLVLMGALESKGPKDYKDHLDLWVVLVKEACK